MEIYLGDGAYALFTECELELYLHNGVEKTGRIVLEAAELRALIDFLKRNGVKV